ncbi:MAG: hypothetical protein AB7G93_14990 [Bdellovibrionales bacterium]
MLDKSVEKSKVPIYDWVRLSVNISDDPLVNFIESEMKVEGFGRFIKLSIQLISQMRSEHGPIVSELSLNTWCWLLGCKKKGLIKFLDHLQNEGHLFWEQNGNIVRIEMPKLREVFDLSLLPRTGRSAKRRPREEEIIILEGEADVERKDNNQGNVETKIQTETGSSFLTDKDFDRLKSALAKSGKEAIQPTASAVESIFSRIGKSESAFSEVQSLISKQFGTSDKSRHLGNAVLAEATKAYREGIKNHEYREYAVRSKAAADARAAKFKNSPIKVDPICNSVMRRLSQIGEGTIYDTDITIEEAEHFIRLNTEYWGESEVREKYREVIQFIKYGEEKSLGDEDGEPVSPIPKKRTLPIKSKPTMVEVDGFDNDDDDDPTPGNFRKTIVVEDEDDIGD